MTEETKKPKKEYVICDFIRLRGKLLSTLFIIALSKIYMMVLTVKIKFVVSFKGYCCHIILQLFLFYVEVSQKHLDLLWRFKKFFFSPFVQSITSRSEQTL